MRRLLTFSSFLFLALLTQFGCANLCAKKVPLNARLTGKDDCIHGFRYYLSRPYLVVSERVCIGQHVSVGELGECTDEGPFRNKLFIKTIDEVGGARYFDWQGNGAAPPGNLKPVPRVVQAPTSGETEVKPEIGKDKPAPKGGAEGKADKRLTDGTPPSLADVSVQVTGASIEEIRKQICPPSRGDAESPFQFAMMPDFEEQMAIKDCNFAAKGRYDLRFADGWQLRSVSGSWDSTEVAVRALQVLGNAVTAAAAVRKEQLDKLPLLQQDRKDRRDKPAYQRAVRIQAAYIEPGVYRLQKSSERQAGCEAPEAPEAVPDQHFSLISALGIPVNVETKVLLWKELP